MPTHQQVCEDFMRFIGYEEPEEIKAMGKKFWESDPNGELFHVFEAYVVLKENGYYEADRQGATM